MVPRRVLVPLLCLALLAAAGAGTGSFAAFTKETGNDGNRITATSVYRIASATRSSTAWSRRDFSGGTATPVDRSDALAFADTVTLATGAFPTAFSATRFLQVDLSGTAPGGLALTAGTPEVVLRFSSPTAGVNVCAYVQTLRVSTGAVLATHNQPSEQFCTSSTTASTFTLPVPEVTNTAIANDLRLRVVGRSSASTAIRFDQITFSASTDVHDFTLYRANYVDQSSGTAGATTWTELAAADARIVNTGTWLMAFNANRYLELRFPANLPPQAVITAATFQHAFHSNVSGQLATACVYYAVWANGAQVGPAINQATPTCSTSATVNTQETITLPALTAAQANNLSIRVYVRSSRSSNSQHDLATLSLTYAVY